VIAAEEPVSLHACSLDDDVESYVKGHRVTTNCVLPKLVSVGQSDSRTLNVRLNDSQSCETKSSLSGDDRRFEQKFVVPLGHAPLVKKIARSSTVPVPQESWNSSPLSAHPEVQVCVLLLYVRVVEPLPVRMFVHERVRSSSGIPHGEHVRKGGPLPKPPFSATQRPPTE
jgi:hypothetical protein